MRHIGVAPEWQLAVYNVLHNWWIRYGRVPFHNRSPSWSHVAVYVCAEPDCGSVWILVCRYDVFNINFCSRISPHPAAPPTTHFISPVSVWRTSRDFRAPRTAPRVFANFAPRGSPDGCSYLAGTLVSMLMFYSHVTVFPGFVERPVVISCYSVSLNRPKRSGCYMSHLL